MKISTIKKLLKEPIARILITLFFCFSCHQWLPIEFVRAILTVSIALKNALLFFLPFLIFSGTAIAFSLLRNNGLRFVIIIISVIVTSNFLNLMFSGLIGCYVIPQFSSLSQKGMPVTTANIMPFFYCNFPCIFPSAWALIGGITSGIISTFWTLPKFMRTINLVHKVTMLFMMKIFIPALPLFLMGFILKLLAEGQMVYFLQTNGQACFIMIGFLCLYLCLWWFCAHKCSKLPAITLLKNIFPAMVTAATTMSSAAALPFSIEAATKNTKDPVVANAVLPISINFHMVGDTICIPILAVIILNSFAYPLPDVSTYMLFGLYFVLNKFAGAGIPGGTIMVSLPILQTYLGFSEEMLALITTFYMLMDPICTCGNVVANNFLVIFIKKAWRCITRKTCNNLNPNTLL